MEPQAYTEKLISQKEQQAVKEHATLWHWEPELERLFNSNDRQTVR
jgi:hypothetical protein